MAIERHRELRRRRHRTKKLAIIARRASKATVSEKVHLAGKIRRLTPGGEIIVARLGLEGR